MSIVQQLDKEELHGCDICFEEDIITVKTSCGCTTKYCSTCIKNMNNKCCVCKNKLAPETKNIHEITENDAIKYYDNLYPYITDDCLLSDKDKPIQIQIYAMNYNITRIMSGLGGLSYSS
ncbi:MAG: hypothetical protein Terrestrivirus4_125 [Terrestrivirus sp.]|uniref:RING-type domain-containing protein n=1 Tax=Terrestrivirus sp. TaxID=2487775 RepID=A0A3G4ZMK3_9VIRU|nr:MAG: hypothetical protein Terrestrivirus4_125 [Terrestrivirus sp.]